MHKLKTEFKGGASLLSGISPSLFKCRPALVSKSNDPFDFVLLEYFSTSPPHVKKHWLLLVSKVFGKSARAPSIVYGLLSLAGIPDIDMLKELIANHPDTPSVVLDAISPGASDNVLQRICEHQNCSRKLLTLLADHKSCEVRMAVIENPNTPIEKIHVLAQDDCVDVRFRMAEAVNMMNEVLEELVLDENPYVSNRASTTLVRKQFESEGRQWDLHKAACQ